MVVRAACPKPPWTLCGYGMSRERVCQPVAPSSQARTAGLRALDSRRGAMCRATIRRLVLSCDRVSDVPAARTWNARLCRHEVGSAVIEQKHGAVRVRVRVQPRASRTEIVGEHDGALKVRIAAPPVDGAANGELIRYLAKTLGIARSRVRVLGGGTGRTKVIEIDEMDAPVVRRALLG